MLEGKRGRESFVDRVLVESNKKLGETLEGKIKAKLDEIWGSEDISEQQPAIELCAELGWETANCFYESSKDSPSPGSSPKGREINIGRETPYDVVLEPRLRVAFRNPFGIRPHLYPLPKGGEAWSCRRSH